MKLTFPWEYKLLRLTAGDAAGYAPGYGSDSRARRYAKARGWLPPLALDDEYLDDPTYKPGSLAPDDAWLKVARAGSKPGQGRAVVDGGELDLKGNKAKSNGRFDKKGNGKLRMASATDDLEVFG